MIQGAPRLLELAKVSHAYGRNTVLSDVNLSLAQGEFLSIIGPSGCGKSTLLKAMAGVLSPTTGEVRFRGRSLSTFSPIEHGILMVWQSLALFPHLDVGGNVAFGLVVRKFDTAVVRKRVATALDLVQLSGFEYRHVDTLSGGEQQRVALARALVLNPAVLLLDEPVQGLDRHLRSQLIGTIRQLHHRLGVTMVMVTHEQAEARRLSTRIAVMRRGRIDQIDVPQVIVQRPATSFVAEFVGDRNVFPGRILDVKGKVATVSTQLGTFKAMVPDWIPPLTDSDDVVYVIDTDKLKIGERGEEHAITAVVEAIVETGVSESIELTIHGAHIIKCERAKISAVPPLILSSRVTVSWNGTDAYILPKS
jgi:ABC-type Fe3+/spermidine/putrescine transport system ATPase subunit